MDSKGVALRATPSDLLRGLDLNQRPSGYENAFPDLARLVVLIFP
jgi:hypothetical protein